MPVMVNLEILMIVTRVVRRARAVAIHTRYLSYEINKTKHFKSQPEQNPGEVKSQLMLVENKRI